MNLDLFDNKLDGLRNSKLTQRFINELETFLNNNKQNEISLDNTIYNGNKITTKYRDKIFVERNNILNYYSQETSSKGQMYYVYGKNSNSDNKYNLCICIDGESHKIIEEDKNKLPAGIDIGVVLRKNGDKYIIDFRGTREVSEKIHKMQEEIFKEQNNFLQSIRKEEHIYEVSESSEDSILLFDITGNSNEAIEEVNIDKEILKTSKPGDLLVYKNGKYQKY